MARKKPSLWKKILFSMLAVIVLLVAAGFYAANYPSSMDRDLAQIHALGHPTTDAEVAATYPLPQGENSQPYFDQYLALCHRLTHKDQQSLDYFTSTEPALITDDDFAKFSKQFATLAEPLIKAASAPGWKPTAPVRDRITTETYAKDTNAYQGVRLLSRLAITDGRTHDLDNALAKLRAAEAITVQEEKFPAFTSGMGPINMETQVLTALSDVAANNPDGPSLDKAMKFMDDLPPPPDFQKAFDSDFVFTVDDFKSPPKQNLPNDLPTRLFDRFYTQPHTRREHDLFVHEVLRIDQELPKDTSDMVAMHQFFMDETSKSAVDTQKYPTAGVASIMYNVTDVWLLQVARRRVTKMGIRVMQAKIQSGAYPATLGTFYGQDIVDPFTGKPLVYKPWNKGVILYSLGRDRTDDGGKPRGISKHYDIVFTAP